MTVTLTHVYDSYSNAEDVVAALEKAGFTRDQISVAGRRQEQSGEESTGDGAAAGATLGGVAVGGAGLLASLGLIAIPGIGPLVAAGVLATTIAGAASGAIAGGIIGALVDYGISKEDAPVYAESIRRGGTLVSVRSDETKADEAEAVMQLYSPVDMQARGKAYRGEGWTASDEGAPLYTEDQRRLERERYSAMK